jgi:hypothetical protein
MKKRETVTISKPEYEQLQAESALMWEMTNDYDCAASSDLRSPARGISEHVHGGGIKG